jgi:hypothetical protein
MTPSSSPRRTSFSSKIVDDITDLLIGGANGQFQRAIPNPTTESDLSELPDISEHGDDKDDEIVKVSKNVDKPDKTKKTVRLSRNSLRTLEALEVSFGKDSAYVRLDVESACERCK